MNYIISSTILFNIIHHANGMLSEDAGGLFRSINKYVYYI